MSNLIDPNATYGSLLEKSEANWKIGQTLLNESDGTLGDCKSDAAVNRLYYGMYQAVEAYAIVCEGFVYDPNGGSVHSKMRRCVREFFRQQKTSDNVSFAQKFLELKALRAQADYEPSHVAKSKLDTVLLNSCAMIRQKLATAAQHETKRRKS